MKNNQIDEERRGLEMRKIVHFIPNEKFTYLYIEKINEIFGEDGHVFFVYGRADNDKIDTSNEKNATFIDDLTGDNARIVRHWIVQADKVIIHSLNVSNKLFAMLLTMQPLYGRKYFWNIWGGDLYNTYWARNNSFKSKVRETLRKSFIKRLPAVGYIPSDYEFLKQHYNTNAKFFLASYAYKFFEVNEKKADHTLSVLLGNSATETSQYEDAINRLSKYKKDDIKVYCVLSYPQNKQYINKVIKHGKGMLGDRFVPQTEFMKYDEYMGFLAKVDVAIFNHNRQQGLGNIASLLYLGKKVIINPMNGCKDYFERIGARLYSVDDIQCTLFEKISVEDKKKNRQCIQRFFSDAEFGNRWRCIFEADF